MPAPDDPRIEDPHIDDPRIDDPDMARLEQERRIAGEVEASRPVTAGRLTPRQRVDSLLDEGSLLEIGALASSQQPEAVGPTPGDGVLTGFGTIGGRPVAVVSEDPLVLARTDGQVAKSKRRRLLKLALQQRLPVVFFADGPDGEPPLFPPGGGELFGGLAEQTDDADLRRRRAPLVSVLLGPVAGQAGELVTQSDVTVGTRLHAGDASPAADVEAVDEHEAVRLAASLVGVLTATGDVTGAPDQTVGSPDGLERTPATGAIAAGLADAGSWVPFIGHPGSGLETGVMRLGGVPVAIAVAGVSGVRELVPGDLRRLRRVVDLSGRMGAPLLLVQDCEGYSERIMSDPGTAGSLVELIGALRSLPSPILCLVCGDGHVLGTYCLGGRQVGPAAILAWPWARIGVVDTPGYEASRISPHRQAGPWLAAGMGLVDDVVTPEETGPWLRWFVRLCHDRRHIPPPPPGDRWYARPSIKGT